MKKQSSLPNTGNEESTPDQQPTAPRIDLSNSYILKGNTLLPRAVPPPFDAKPIGRNFKSEKEFESLVLKNTKILFGENTVLLDARKQFAKELSNYPIPAIFLFDFSDSKPKFYMLKIALVKQSFIQLFMQMTQLFSLMRNPNNQDGLIKMLCEVVDANKEWKKELKAKFGDNNFVDVLKASMKSDLSCVFIMDGERKELVSVTKTYIETWGEIVKLFQLRKFAVEKEIVYAMHPSSLAELKEKREVKVPKEKIIHTEDHHLAKGNGAVQSLYEKLKMGATKLDKTIIFNAKGKHYISMKKGTGKNLAFFHMRKDSIYLVVMLEEKIVRKMVKHHEIKSLPESVQKFWNGKCTGLVFSSTEHLKEISEVLKKLIK